ncbi:MAG: ABC transporter ATP-binding protein [Ktedonobacteraceae bacterium]|nr:ABC transporter ATP-binding protein [Ktedonobacteraceae bacterium]
MQTSPPFHTPEVHSEGASGERSLTPAIEVRGLRKIYSQLLAVDDISFAMYRGEAFGFLGPNGAGKSTVVKILTGLVAPTQGMISVLGQPLGDREVRRRIGYLPEFPTFHRWLKASAFLEFHGQLYGLRGKTLAKRCKEVLEMVGLTGREQQKLGTFSKGMLQRIGLAQALLNQPDLLILDELVSGLDPVGQRDMRDLLLYLKSEGTSIFLNSHQLADVEAVCDRVAIINQGRILKVGTPTELFGNQLILEVRVNSASEELLQQLKHVVVAIQRDENDPDCLLAEIENDEQAADIADIVHACGARLYSLAPRRRSLEQLFFQTIETFSHS